MFSVLSVLFSLLAILLSFYTLTLAIQLRRIHVSPSKTSTFAWIAQPVEGRGMKYTVQSNSIPVSFLNAFELLENEDRDFIMSFKTLFMEFDAESIFFECAPISMKLIASKPFEFVLLPASRLDKVTADTVPFHSQLQNAMHSGKTVAVFENLSGDSMLIIPCPNAINLSSSSADLNMYAHLQRFVRHARASELTEFFAAVSKASMAKLSRLDREQLLWISTSGLGVSWLHMRLDDRPKYYNFNEYKVG